MIAVCNFRRASELSNDEQWSQTNNLKLNRANTQEIVRPVAGYKGKTPHCYPTVLGDRVCKQSQSSWSYSQQQALSHRACLQVCPVAACTQDNEKSWNDRHHPTACLEIGLTWKHDNMRSAPDEDFALRQTGNVSRGSSVVPFRLACTQQMDQV